MRGVASTLATSALATHNRSPEPLMSSLRSAAHLLAVQRHWRPRAQVKLFFTDVGKLPPPVLQFQRVTFGYSPSQVLYQDVRPRMRCIAVRRPVCRVSRWESATHSKSAQLEFPYPLFKEGLHHALRAQCQGRVSEHVVGRCCACARGRALSEAECAKTPCCKVALCPARRWTWAWTWTAGWRLWGPTAPARARCSSSCAPCPPWHALREQGHPQGSAERAGRAQDGRPGAAGRHGETAQPPQDRLVPPAPGRAAGPGAHAAGVHVPRVPRGAQPRCWQSRVMVGLGSESAPGSVASLQACRVNAACCADDGGVRGASMSAAREARRGGR